MEQLLNGLRIAVDKGHGGNDPGAIDPPNPAENDVLNTQEKAINRFEADMSIALFRLLGAEILDVAPGDETVSLQERCNRANKWGAHFFLSWHNNWNSSNTPAGAEAHIYAKGGEAEIAAGIIDGFAKQDGINWRGVKVSNFHVLRETSMPAVLIEGGFISTPAEEALLNDQTYLDKLVKVVVKGICVWRTGKVPAMDAGELLELRSEVQRLRAILGQIATLAKGGVS